MSLLKTIQMMAKSLFNKDASKLTKKEFDEVENVMRRNYVSKHKTPVLNFVNKLRKRRRQNKLTRKLKQKQRA